jgi:hypothetical protein
VASPFFIGAKTFLAHVSDARSDEICRAIEFEEAIYTPNIGRLKSSSMGC